MYDSIEDFGPAVAFFLSALHSLIIRLRSLGKIGSRSTFAITRLIAVTNRFSLLLIVKTQRKSKEDLIVREALPSVTLT